MNKKVLLSVLIVVLICSALIIADYFALFGMDTKIKLDFVEARFKTIDAETGGLVLDVGVRCLQKNNDNACTRRESHRLGIGAYRSCGDNRS